MEEDGFITVSVFPRPADNVQLELFSSATPLSYAQELDMLGWRAALEMPFTAVELKRMRRLKRLIIEQAGGQ